MTSAIISPDTMGKTASGAQWIERAASFDEIEKMSAHANIDPILARILVSRGVRLEDAKRYLNPKLRDQLPDPFVLRDMETATETIVEAIQRKKKIGVFGDYDVDGTSAASILKIYFDAIGVELEVHLPDRFTEGYGPSSTGFSVLADNGVELVITVDCGSSSDALFEEFQEKGVSTIVLDHHVIHDKAPSHALAVVNPNRPGDNSGLKNFSAAGIAFLAVIAINRRLRDFGYFENRPEPDIRDLLDLAALGLVCDVMEISGVARVLVAQGLQKIQGNANLGLLALAEVADVKKLNSTYSLGFVLGPRINAAGRIGHAQFAFELLTTKDDERRRTLALKLDELNTERRAIEQRVCEAALECVARDKRDEEPVIIVAGEDWHPGVVGIVAGRLKERFNRPAIVISLDECVGKGSCRSIDGVDLGAAVARAKSDGLLLEGGGHAMAAGLTIREQDIPSFRLFLNDVLAASIDTARKNRRLVIDGVVEPRAVTANFAELISRAGPYGPGNPEPVFAIKNVQANYAKIVGKDHVAATLSAADGAQFRAICFRAAERPIGAALLNGDRIHVAGRINADDWRGGNAGQFQLVDIAPAN